MANVNAPFALIHQGHATCCLGQVMCLLCCMPQWAEELSSVYASVEDVDFLVGCLAENPRPEGYLISETAFYVFIMNASRRLLCDRFYQVGMRPCLGSREASMLAG